MTAVITFKMEVEAEEFDYEEMDEAPPSNPPVTRIARQLALAHHIQRLVDEGKLRDYAHAARLLKVTRARMAQVMDLLMLAPKIQAGILQGKLDTPERQLRPVLRTPIWKDQESLLKRKLQ